MVELEACGIPVTWLLTPTLTSVEKSHALRQAGLWSFWAAPTASAHGWPTATEMAMDGQGLLGQAQWGSQVVQWGHPYPLRILPRVNSCIKMVLCAYIGILFDLHQQLTRAMALGRIKHMNPWLIWRLCLARTTKDPPGSCEEKCASEPFFMLYFYSRCSFNYAFVRHNLVWFPCNFAVITASLAWLKILFMGS